MIDYFYKSKKDLTHLSYELLKNELGQEINRIISLIKVREKDILAPMLAEQKIQVEQIQGWAPNLNYFSNCRLMANYVAGAASENGVLGFGM